MRFRTFVNLLSHPFGRWVHCRLLCIYLADEGGKTAENHEESFYWPGTKLLYIPSAHIPPHDRTHLNGIPKYERAWEIQSHCVPWRKKEIGFGEYNSVYIFIHQKNPFHSLSTQKNLLILSLNEIIQSPIRSLNLAQSPGSPGSCLLEPAQVQSRLAIDEQLHRSSHSDGPLQLV